MFYSMAQDRSFEQKMQALMEAEAKLKSLEIEQKELKALLAEQKRNEQERMAIINVSLSNFLRREIERNELRKKYGAKYSRKK
jgi:hypothetical protein